MDVKSIKNELNKNRIRLIEFFRYIRAKWIENLSKDDKRYIENILKTKIDKFNVKRNNAIEKIIRNYNLRWDDIKFHMNFRVTQYKELLEVMKNIDKELGDVIKKGYNLSIMPLMLITKNKDLLHKFIPKKDFFTEHIAKTWDPYGIFTKKVKIFRKGVYICSRKFEKAVLMNITSSCPLGCVGCYKGFFTRIKWTKFYTNLRIAVSKQVKLLVEYLNEHPEIKSVIVSGGEPFLLDNRGIKTMIDEFKNTRHLVELRFCTGVIFQGLPFRIDYELLKILKRFEDETGIKINFNAHLSHPAQFTPETLVAIRKIVRYGFPINTQIPLQRNVNIFIDDFEKTIKTLYTLAELQGKTGLRPYKYILHMNVGSLEYSVPLEFMLEILGEMKYRIDHPWPETWQPISVCILCKQGNILLSPQLLQLIKKKVFKSKQIVKYYIPVPIGNRKWKTVEYIEPLIKGYNDT